MITERGRVVAVEPDCLWIETIRKSTCNSCAAQKGCGHGLMNKLEGSLESNRRHHVRALLGDVAATEFAVDDMVEISIPERILVSAPLLVYGLPLLFMLMGAALASQWQSTDLFAVLGAATGFVLGFAVVKLHALHNSHNEALQPMVVAPSSAPLKSQVQAVQPF